MRLTSDYFQKEIFRNFCISFSNVSNFLSAGDLNETFKYTPRRQRIVKIPKESHNAVNCKTFETLF